MSHSTIILSQEHYGDTSLSHKTITGAGFGGVEYGKKSTQWEESSLIWKLELLPTFLKQIYFKVGFQIHNCSAALL